MVEEEKEGSKSAVLESATRCQCLHICDCSCDPLRSPPTNQSELEVNQLTPEVEYFTVRQPGGGGWDGMEGWWDDGEAEPFRQCQNNRIQKMHLILLLKMLDDNHSSCDISFNPAVLCYLILKTWETELHLSVRRENMYVFWFFYICCLFVFSHTHIIVYHLFPPLHSYNFTHS